MAMIGLASLCCRPLSFDEVVGRYQGSVRGSAQTIDLKADGTFTWTEDARPDRPPVVGKWDFTPGETGGRISLEERRADGRRGTTYLLGIGSVAGKVSIGVDPDEGGYLLRE